MPGSAMFGKAVTQGCADRPHTHTASDAGYRYPGQVESARQMNIRYFLI